MDRKRLVFISNMGAPYQIKFCYALQEHFDAEFWFHEHVGPRRPDWWRIDLGDKCKVLNRVIFKRSKYLSLDIVRQLNEFDPDIVVLGGFLFPSSIVAYYWARSHQKKTVVFTELFRSRRGVPRGKGLYTTLVDLVYRDVDAVFTSAVEGTEQLRSALGFGDRVHTAQYPIDIDEHLKHPLRTKKDALVLLFANRLTQIYNPLLAIRIFDSVLRRHQGSRMLINASGELFAVCKSEVRKLGLESQIEFLDKIESWDNLHSVYRASDIMILPASFSAGNYSILEAMASGMGIVISNKVLGANIYRIENGRNGFVCNPNIDEFVKAIDCYYDHSALLETHGRVNKKLVEKYSVVQTALLWRDLINSTIL